MSLSPTILADGILEASVAHGVVRLTLARTAADGKPVAAGLLAIPLAQLPAVTKTLGALLQQLEERVRAQAESANPTPPAPEPAPAPGAFRFG